MDDKGKIAPCRKTWGSLHAVSRAGRGAPRRGGAQGRVLPFRLAAEARGVPQVRVRP